MANPPSAPTVTSAVVLNSPPSIPKPPRSSTDWTVMASPFTTTLFVPAGSTTSAPGPGTAPVLQLPLLSQNTRAFVGNGGFNVTTLINVSPEVKPARRAAAETL